MSYNSGSFSAAKLCPKFKDCALSEKEPLEYIFVWIKIIGGIVSNLEHGDGKAGPELESLLDNYLKRSSNRTALRPAFLDNPALALGDDFLSTSEGDGITLTSGDSVPSAQGAQSSAETTSMAPETLVAMEGLEAYMSSLSEEDPLLPEVRAQLEIIKAQLLSPVGTAPSTVPGSHSQALAGGLVCL